jgi:hypothetical protein
LDPATHVVASAAKSEIGSRHLQQCVFFDFFEHLALPWLSCLRLGESHDLGTAVHSR